MKGGEIGREKKKERETEREKEKAPDVSGTKEVGQASHSLTSSHQTTCPSHPLSIPHTHTHTHTYTPPHTQTYVHI